MRENLQYLQVQTEILVVCAFFFLCWQIPLRLQWFVTVSIVQQVEICYISEPFPQTAV